MLVDRLAASQLRRLRRIIISRHCCSGRTAAAQNSGLAPPAQRNNQQSTDPGLTWTTYSGKATNATDVIKVTYTPGTAGADGAITVDFAAAS